MSMPTKLNFVRADYATVSVTMLPAQNSQLANLLKFIHIFATSLQLIMTGDRMQYW